MWPGAVRWNILCDLGWWSLLVVLLFVVLCCVVLCCVVLCCVVLCCVVLCCAMLCHAMLVCLLSTIISFSMKLVVLLLIYYKGNHYLFLRLTFFCCLCFWSTPSSSWARRSRNSLSRVFRAFFPRWMDWMRVAAEFSSRSCRCCLLTPTSFLAFLVRATLWSLVAAASSLAFCTDPLKWYSLYPFHLSFHY